MKHGMQFKDTNYHMAYIYWATKETPRLYIPISFETKVSENIFLIKYKHYHL